MRYDLNFFLRKTQFALMAALGVLPLVLVLNAFFAPELLAGLWLLVLIYVVLAVGAMVIPGKLRIWIVIAAALLLVLFWGKAYPGSRQWMAALSAGIYALLLIWSMGFGSMGQADELPAYVTWVGVSLHLLVQLVLLIAPMQNFTGLDAVAPWLTAAMTAFLFLAVLAANRRSLLKASTGRQEVPTAMRRRNLLMTALIFAGAMVLSFNSLVTQGIHTVFAWLIQLLMALAFGTEDLIPDPTEPVETVPPTTEDLGTLPPAPEIRVDAWFYVFAQTVAIIALAILVFFALRRVLRKFPGLKAALTRHFSASSEDYVDEVSNTREGGFVDQIRSLRKKRRENVRESQLPPRERIRFRYRKLMKKHPKWTSGQTARENLPEELASVYERARYSQHPITEEQAEQFRQNAKKL